MNVCILSKFPPFEGGISSRTYWLARAFADAGISVHVVSNSKSAERSYRIDDCLSPLPNIPGVTVHEVEAEFPWHIPDEFHSLAKLIDKTLEVMDCHKIDVIDSGYLLPYGIAAFLVSRLNGVPYVVRHGGSDLAKFLRTGRLKYLLKLVLDNAAAIVTDRANERTFEGYKAKKVLITPYFPNPAYFRPREDPRNNVPNILFVGKINWHWERKGLDRILRCVQLLPPNWKMQWVGQGRGEEKLRDFAKQEMNIEINMRRFVSPWDMPDLLQQADYIYSLSINDPIPTFSNVVMEARYCGTTVIIDAGANLGSDFLNRDGLEDWVLRVDSANPELMARSIQEHWERKNDRILSLPDSRGIYENYLSANIHMLAEAANCL